MTTAGSIAGYAYYKGGAPASNRVETYTTPSIYTTGGADPNLRKSWMYDNPELANISKKEFEQKLSKAHECMQKGIVPNALIQNPDNLDASGYRRSLGIFKHISPTQ